MAITTKKLLVVCFVGALCFGVGLVDEVKADLLWHLDLEGNLNDTAGHASGPYHGKAVAPAIGGGTATFVPGRMGQALAFDGNALRIDLPGTAEPVQVFTIAFFMRSSEDWYNQSMAFVTKPHWTDTGNFAMRSSPNDDNEMLNNVGETSVGVDGAFWSGSHPFYINRWTHFAITYTIRSALNDTVLLGSTKLYVDGVEVDSAKDVSSLVAFDEGFTLGAWNFGPDSPFNDQLTGELDDVRFYDEALSRNAIADLATAGKPQLVWHLEFEDNLDDTAGHASGPYHATEVAPSIGGGMTAFVPGRIGQALSFDGNDLRVDVPGTMEPMSEFTVSFFMKSSEDWYNQSMAFVTKPQGSAGNFVMRSIPDEDNEMWNDVGNTSVGVDGTFWSGSHPLYIDRWNHFALTYSVASGETKLYFDGLEVSSSTGASEPVEFNDGFTLGAWNFSDDQPYNDRLTGELDDVRFYDKALDALAIAEHAAEGAPPVDAP